MLTRRDALLAAVVGSAATTLGPRSAVAKGTPAAAGSSRSVMPKPLPFDPKRVPGLPEKLLRSHHEKNYTGAVKKLNAVRAELKALPAGAPVFVRGALKQKELAFANSVTLHELYFANLGAGPPATKTVRRALADGFGRFDDFEEELRALAGSLAGGSGWVILGWDLHAGGLTLSPSGGHAEGRASTLPVLVLDMYEHSYHMTYGTNAGAYVDAFWKNVKWSEVERRLRRARSVSAP